MNKSELKRKTVSIALIALVNNAHSLIRDESAEEGRYIYKYPKNLGGEKEKNDDKGK
jgi:hypothetical protein